MTTPTPIESISEESRGVVTYDLGDGRHATFNIRDIQNHGLEKMLKCYGVEVLNRTARIPVMRDCQKIGTLPADFNPYFIESTSFMYDPRPGDFKRDGDVWVAARTLGGGDLECVPGFVWDRGE